MANSTGKVWTLLERSEHEGDTLYGVYSSKEKAEDALALRGTYYKDFLDIEEVEIDAPPERY